MHSHLPLKLSHQMTMVILHCISKLDHYYRHSCSTVCMITITDRTCSSYLSLHCKLSRMLTQLQRGHFGILCEEWRTWSSCRAFMGNSPSLSSLERGPNVLTVEMSEREKKAMLLLRRRKAFTGLCIIKQLKRLIRDGEEECTDLWANYFHGNHSSCKWPRTLTGGPARQHKEYKRPLVV